MRVAAIALLASLGMAASGSALAGKSFSGNVGAAVPTRPPAVANPGHGHGHHHHSTFVGAGFGWGYPWGWWYYCESSTSYYPYVKECPAGWERVAPR